MFQPTSPSVTLPPCEKGMSPNQPSTPRASHSVDERTVLRVADSRMSGAEGVVVAESGRDAGGASALLAGCVPSAVAAQPSEWPQTMVASSSHLAPWLRSRFVVILLSMRSHCAWSGVACPIAARFPAWAWQASSGQHSASPAGCVDMAQAKNGTRRCRCAESPAS
jgi:hypothetical protein